MTHLNPSCRQDIKQNNHFSNPHVVSTYFFFLRLGRRRSRLHWLDSKTLYSFACEGVSTKWCPSFCFMKAPSQGHFMVSVIKAKRNRSQKNVKPKGRKIKGYFRGTLTWNKPRENRENLFKTWSSSWCSRVFCIQWNTAQTLKQAQLLP